MLVLLTVLDGSGHAALQPVSVHSPEPRAFATPKQLYWMFQFNIFVKPPQSRAFSFS